MTSRYPILNIWFDALNLQQIMDRVVMCVESGNRPHTLFASNPEKNFSVPKDPVLYEMFKNADLLIPDGIGIIFAARVLHKISIQRITGVRVMQEICRLSAEKGYKIFLYGAKENVNETAAGNLKKIFPGIQIVGRANGYVSETEMDNLINHINKSDAQILFLGLGSPKQEKWFSQYHHRLHNIRICQGIGGTLDVLSGKTKRAPNIFRRFGLEWLYRLMTDPKRWKRQKVYPVFATQVIWEKLRVLFNMRK